MASAALSPLQREYMTHMVEDHQKDVSAFQTEAQQGQDPDVKAFASQTLPTLEEHLQQARSIVNGGVNTGTSTSSPSPTNTR
nr:DUF4142 domain-containing protein [Nostoc sp. PCC 7107]